VRLQQNFELVWCDVEEEEEGERTSERATRPLLILEGVYIYSLIEEESSEEESRKNQASAQRTSSRLASSPPSSLAQLTCPAHRIDKDY